MNHPRRVFLAVALVCALFPAARADETDDYVKAQMQRRHIPGLSLVVVRGGRVVKERGYGLASVELNVPATPDTIFEIGSISKQLTAAGCMLLVEEGKLGLDDKISKYLPDTPPAWGGVTVRHLLTHTSGIKSYTGLPGFELTKHLKRDAFVKAIGAYPLNFAPGDAYSYSNTGYNLLGFIIEAGTHRTYWDFVNARIFKPLGMLATRDRDPHDVIPNRATGYEWEGGALTGRDYDLTDVFSAGAVVSTTRDLAKWDAALDTERLLQRSSLAQIWTPVRLNGGKNYPYGLGWFIETWRGHPVVRHTGQTAGFGGSIARYTDDRLTVIVLCNLGESGVAGKIGQGVAKLYVPALSLRTLREQPDPDPPTTRLLRDVLRARLAGQTDAKLFAPDTRDTLATDSSKSYWRQLADYGPLKSLIFVSVEPSDNNRAWRYRAALGEHFLLLKYVLTGEGKIVEMSVEEEE